MQVSEEADNGDYVGRDASASFDESLKSLLIRELRKIRGYLLHGSHQELKYDRLV
ncbi:MAG: hypothetical protein ACP5XB_17825 [Isosphaeraceae bacterium]